MTFLADATQENIDREIALSKIRYDIACYETQLLDQKRNLAVVKKNELTILGKMREIQANLDIKKSELANV